MCSALSGRLGLTAHTDPEKIERDLMALVPAEHWTLVSHLLIDHGRGSARRGSPNAAGAW